MFKRVQVLFAAAVFGMSCSAAWAAEQGDAAEAHAMLDKAAVHFKNVGKNKALTDFTDDAAFKDRDLYVYCVDRNAIWTAHGSNKVMIGRDVTKVRDMDGNSVGEEILAAMKDHDEGSVDYKWPNPLTKKSQLKTTFLRAMGDQICAVGFYH